MRYLLMLLLAFSLVACDPGAPGVYDNTSEAVEDVGAETGEGAEEVGEGIEEGVGEAGEAIEGAGEEIPEGD